MKVFGLLCKCITLVCIVVVIILMCLLIHIWILLILIVYHSRFHLSAERSGKGKVIVIQTCVRDAFDRLVGGYGVKSCRYLHIGYIVNLSSIVGHVRFEADLSLEERSHLVNFGKIGYSTLQSKTALCCLFSSRKYDSNMIYRVVKKARNLHYGDATDCMLKLVEIGNSHRSKGGLFEMVSDRGGISSLYVTFHVSLFE